MKHLIGRRIEVTLNHNDIKEYFEKQGEVRGTRLSPSCKFEMIVVKMDDGNMLELYDDEFKIIE